MEYIGEIESWNQGKFPFTFLDGEIVDERRIFSTGFFP